MMTIAHSEAKPGMPAASLKAVTLSGPLLPDDVILKIQGDYAYHITRATGDTVLVDLRGVKIAGVAKDGKLGSGVVTDYHLLQYMDASGTPVVRVQLNLRAPETLRAYREAAGLRLAFGSRAEPTAPYVSSVAPQPAPARSHALAAAARPRHVGPLEVSGVSITSGPGGETYVDIATTNPAPYTVFRLPNPPRLVVDVQGAKNSAAKAYPARSDYLKGVRVGQFRSKDPAVVRVVADLAGDPAFDVHARSGGVRVALRAKKMAGTAAAAKPATAAVSVPTAPAVAAVERDETKPVEKIRVPRPDEILTAKEEPTEVTKAAVDPEKVAAAPAPVEKAPTPPIEFQNTLPATSSSPDVAAAPKPTASGHDRGGASGGAGGTHSCKQPRPDCCCTAGTAREDHG